MWTWSLRDAGGVNEARGSCEISLKSVLSVSAGAASVLPDPAIISILDLSCEHSSYPTQVN